MKFNSLNFFSLFGVVIFSFFSCSPKILDRPIVFDAEREALSLAYMKDRYGLEKEKAEIEVKMVVVHWTAISTLEQSFEAFYKSKLPDVRPDIASASSLNVSVQFLVDRDGTIYQMLPENKFARHVIGLNHCSIGIENVGDGDKHQLTEAQLKSNIRLIRYLMKRHPIDYVIGHHEYRLFEGHELWLEKDAGYRTVKYDPGEAFMSRIRESLNLSKLKPLPVK